MAWAIWPSSCCTPTRDLFFFFCCCCPKRRYETLDIFTSQPTFRKQLCSPHRLHVTSGKWIFEEWSPENRTTHLIRAVAAVDSEVLVPIDDGQRSPSLQFESNLDSQGYHCSIDHSSEIDEGERLRRMRISMANKGNVPWNKGKKHSPETIKRIQERTKLAMQDPKVKMKLMNFGHAQSEETRIKIGAGVCKGFQRRRERLMVQESCLFEWQNIIAEASRKGYYASEEEMQWGSYKIIDKQLKQVWSESVEERKTMAKAKGDKRAPKSLEHRRKISASISAKWADPEYRGRVCSALSKYHGVPVGVEGNHKRSSSGSSSLKRELEKMNSIEPKDSEDEPLSIKKATIRRRENATPSYNDPSAGSNLEMIRKIREGRASMAYKKRETIERAKLLIAEAEKAAEALEIPAIKSPLAKASLIETRKLIAEAARLIERTESRHLAAHNTSGASQNLFHVHESNHSNTVLNKPTVNGSSHQRKDEEFDRFTFQNAQKPNSSKEDSSVKDLKASQLKINGFKYKDASESKECEGTSSAKKSKRWVRGRLVEVDDE